MSMLAEDGAIFVLEGPERADDGERDGEFLMEDDMVRKKFKKFINEFVFSVAHAKGGKAHIGTLLYQSEFKQNCSSGSYFLKLNLNHMDGHEDGDLLAHRLKEQPARFIEECEKGLQELYKENNQLVPGTKVPEFQLQLTCDVNLEGSIGGLKPKLIREITSNEVEKLVVVQGIIIQAQRPRHKAHKIMLRCTNCENQKELRVPPGFSGAHVPRGCEGNVLKAQGEKCPSSPFQVQTELCTHYDEHILKLQELPENTPVGEMPRQMMLIVNRYLVDRCTAGTRLTVIGIFSATEGKEGGVISKTRQKGANTVKFSYIQALGLDVGQGNVNGQSLPISKEEEERFEAMSKDPEIRTKIYQSIAPSICASKKDVTDEVKKAVACLLFGGSRKALPDGTRLRGDINALLLGDPSTAKSQFLKFAERAAPISVYTSGKGSSAAGLTAAVIKESSGGFALEGGAMVLADGGVVCIDEFDKMRNDDRVAIHEAMEQQTISIAKAGITTVLNTRCSVLAAANPVFGTYDDLSSTAEQVDFQTTILSRFDMIFLVRDVRDEERDLMIARHVIELHKGGQEKDNDRAPIPVAELRKYISYCRSRAQPRLTATACETLQNHYVDIRAKMAQEKRDGKESVIPITVRQLEAIVRLSESLAKMELKDDVDVAHVEEALRLFTLSTLDAANRERGCGVESFTEEMQREIHRAEEIVRRRIQHGGRMHKHQILVLLTQNGVEEAQAKRAIHIMTMRGELTEKAGLTLQRS